MSTTVLPLAEQTASADGPQPAVRMAVFDLRTEPGSRPEQGVIEKITAAVSRVIPVHQIRCVPGGALLTLRGDAQVRIVAGFADPPRSTPVGTVQVTVVVERAEGLTEEQLDAVMAAARRVPFTPWEWHELLAQMPLTAQMPEHLPTDCLAAIAPMMTVHHMRDFLVMVDAVQRLGVPTDAITVLDKAYRYQHTDRVDAHLAALGITVYPWTRAADALEDHARRAAALGRQGLLIDDGGYTLPVLIDQRPDLLKHFRGLVEQTTSGITKLEPYGDDLPLPVFSVAQSRMKAAIEPYGIADAVWRNITRLLPEEKFEGQPAVVIGFGAIGAQLADVLRQRRMRVAVHDRDVTALVTAVEHGYPTHPSLRALLTSHRPMLIVGATGRTSFTARHVGALTRDCYLVSTTSRDREFALADLRAAAVEESDAGQVGFRLLLPQKIQATVLADGQPVNFHYAESMPNKYADLVFAALIIGASTLAREGHGFARGHNVAPTNEVLATSGLLERYYQRFGPGSPA
jgi:S-adenosylhomocysteine hydrolase